MPSKNGKTAQTNGEAKVELVTRPMAKINGVLYEMRTYWELDWQTQLSFEKNVNALAPIAEYFAIEDDDDDDAIAPPPPEIIERYAKANRRLARLGFPEVPVEVWRDLAPPEIARLADQFVRHVQAGREGNLEPPKTAAPQTNDSLATIPQT